MRRYFRIYRAFVVQFTKTIVEYRADFLIGIFSFIFVQAAGLAAIAVMFRFIPDLAGWEFAEVLLIYAMFQLPRGIDHLITDNLWLLPNYVKQGTFDKYLTKPMNVLFHLVAERFQFEALGELIVGVVLMSIAIPTLGIEMTFTNCVFLLIFIVIGAVIYTSLKLITATAAFWLKNSQSLIEGVYEISTFTQRPLAIYPAGIRFMLTYILPFAFTSYYPAAYMLGIVEPGVLMLQGIITAIVFAFLSYRFWLYGLSRYESSGN